MDVVVGTAFGCGGYAMALLVYIFNRNTYHPLMRPALLSGVFGYTLAGLAVMIDLGRYWNAFNLLLPWYAQLNSVIFEVALCVMAYTTVLWIEFWPAFLERMPLAFKQRFNLDRLQVFLKRYLFLFIGLGVLLPTMHQSSLGSVLLVMGFQAFAAVVHKLAAAAVPDIGAGDGLRSGVAGGDTDQPGIPAAVGVGVANAALTNRRRSAWRCS